MDYVITNPPAASTVDTQLFVQGIAVLLMMHLEWRLEDISRNLAMLEDNRLVQDIVDTIEDRNWPAWILRLAFGLLGWAFVGYNWAAIQSFFTVF